MNVRARALPGITRLAGVAMVLAAALAPAHPQTCERVVAVGDLHGSYDGLVTMLERAKLVTGDPPRWSGGAACLVQLGDVVDRGARSRDVLDLLMGLVEQAPERVHVLLGNHEVMNVVGDLRYVDPGEYAAFAGEERPEDREAGWAAWLDAAEAAGIDEAAARRSFDAERPPGWFAHRRAFAPEGRYGAWLLERPVALVLDGSLFVHGGLTPADAKLGPRALTERTRRAVLDYLGQRERLARSGVVSVQDDFTATMRKAADFAARMQAASGGSNDRLSAARAVLEPAQELVREDGPLWNRRLALAGAQDEDELDAILAAAGVRRIVIGHTTQEGGRVVSNFGNRVFLIDTGAGPAYAGSPSALMIDGGGTVRALYPEGQQMLVDPLADDAAYERFLSEATVQRIEEIGVGITKPRRLELERDGLLRRAAFKTIDTQSMDLTRWRHNAPEFNFTDNYRYERAAYLLDRELGMNMVPVTVLRRVGEEEGAVIFWVEGALDEQRRRERGAPQDPAALLGQLSVMRLFDALILNSDRNLGNQLWTPLDGRLHLIDHSRSFRLAKQLPPAYLSEPIARLPRTLVARLAALEERQVAERMGGVLSHAQVRAMFARRERLLAKIEEDRKKWGDGVVFDEATAATAAPQPVAAKP